MDLSKIKNLIKQNGDKFILVENNVPEIVMISFQEYEKLTGLSKTSGSIIRSPFKKEAILPAQAGDPDGEAAETEFVIPLGPAESPTIKPIRLEDISLEDLPL